MVRLQPMPDEVSAGHLGRLRWLNEWPDRLTATQSLQRTLKAHGVESESPDAFFLLAAIADMPPTDYARLHSMLAVRRVASDLTAGVLHGEIQGAVCAARTYGVWLPRGLPLVCVHCIREDLNHWGFSWYRRSHQLIGVDWCEKHGHGLSRVHSRDPFWLTPYWHLKLGSTVGIDPYADRLEAVSDFVRRFVAVSSASLLMAAPVRSSAISARLAQRARSMGLQLGGGPGRALSRLICEQAPTPWLREHFPDVLANQESGETPVDKALRREGFVADGQYYLLAMAALYEDADTALREALGMQAETRSARSRARTA